MSDTTTGNATGLPPIRMTAFDLWKLDALLKARAGARSWRADEILRRELQRSIVMDESQIPPDVATMWSQVEFRVAGAAATGRELQVRGCDVGPDPVRVGDPRSLGRAVDRACGARWIPDAGDVAAGAAPAGDA
jgi:hypothetical protein